MLTRNQLEQHIEQHLDLYIKITKEAKQFGLAYIKEGYIGRSVNSPAFIAMLETMFSKQTVYDLVDKAVTKRKIKNNLNNF